jgi:HSP20 family molecular chaperone IbpA
MLMPSIMGFGNNLFDDLFDGFAVPTGSTVRYNTPSNMMSTDVKEFEDGYELSIALPGYKKEDIQAELKDGYLNITASTDNRVEDKAEDGKYIRRERYVGKCSRSFFVGEALKQEDIQAKFEDGVLKLNVPKKEAKPVVEEKKYIQIA